MQHKAARKTERKMDIKKKTKMCLYKRKIKREKNSLHIIQHIRKNSGNAAHQATAELHALLHAI